MINQDLLLTILVYYGVIGFIVASIVHVVEGWEDGSTFLFPMIVWPLLTIVFLFDYYIKFLNGIRKLIKG